jgi:hypothetical protein
MPRDSTERAICKVKSRHVAELCLARLYCCQNVDLLHRYDDDVQPEGPLVIRNILNYYRPTPCMRRAKGSSMDLQGVCKPDKRSVDGLGNKIVPLQQFSFQVKSEHQVCISTVCSND